MALAQSANEITLNLKCLQRSKKKEKQAKMYDQ